MEKIETSVGADRVAGMLITLNEKQGSYTYLFVIDNCGNHQIITDINMKKAIFPKGYYYLRKESVITNKGNTKDGSVDRVDVLTMVPLK